MGDDRGTGATHRSACSRLSGAGTTTYGEVWERCGEGEEVWSEG